MTTTLNSSQQGVTVDGITYFEDGSYKDRDGRHDVPVNPSQAVFNRLRYWQALYWVTKEQHDDHLRNMPRLDVAEEDEIKLRHLEVALRECESRLNVAHKEFKSIEPEVLKLWTDFEEKRTQWKAAVEQLNGETNPILAEHYQELVNDAESKLSVVASNIERRGFALPEEVRPLIIPPSTDEEIREAKDKQQPQRNKNLKQIEKEREQKRSRQR